MFEKLLNTIVNIGYYCALADGAIVPDQNKGNTPEDLQKNAIPEEQQ